MSPGAWRAAVSPRVGLDVAPARRPETGVSIYVFELAAALRILARDQIVRLGIRPGGPLDGGPRVHGESRLEGRHHLVWLQAFADGNGRAAGCRLMHYTNAVAPIRATIPFVLTIHDLSLVRRPLQHPFGRLAAVPFLVAAARQARLIITPSRATADEVRRVLHVPRSRLVVIPLAARRVGRDGSDTSVIDSLGLEAGRYVLSIGTIEPRKNGVGLLSAFERLSLRDERLRLVFAGGQGWRDGPFGRALAASPVRDRVVLAGYQPDASLAALLAGSAVMAYPSFYEGFGLPVIEAMAAGVPVVTSRVSSMPEAAGGAAVLVDPYDVASIAAGLGEALSRREELAAAGRARVRGRTWLDVGRETLDAYRRVLAQVQ